MRKRYAIDFQRGDDAASNVRALLDGQGVIGSMAGTDILVNRYMPVSIQIAAKYEKAIVTRPSNFPNRSPALRPGTVGPHRQRRQNNSRRI